MTTASSEFATFIRSGDNDRNRVRAALLGQASECNLYCDTCRRERPHTLKRGPEWTRITCACGFWNDWKTEQVGR